MSSSTHQFEVSLRKRKELIFQNTVSLTSLKYYVLKRENCTAYFIYTQNLHQCILNTDLYENCWQKQLIICDKYTALVTEWLLQVFIKIVNKEVSSY